METTIVGLYDDKTAARKALGALNNAGFDEDRIHVEMHGADSDWSSRSSNLLSTLTSVGVPRDEAEFYAEGVRRGGSLIILRARAERADRAAELMNAHEPVTRETREAEWREQGYTGYDGSATAFTAEEADAERARYRERRAEAGAHTERLTEAKEELHVGKREVRSGGVRVHKRVQERAVEEQVTLREEEVRVEERDATHATTDRDGLFEEKTIEMTERREEPVVEKKTKVTGEVVVEKDAHQRTETIRDTVRETKVDVERLGASEGYRACRDRFQKHFQTTFGTDHGAYDDFEPAYRHGYAYGADERYSDVTYDRAEPNLRRDYEERHGEGTFERVKQAIRHAYEHARSTLHHEHA